MQNWTETPPPLLFMYSLNTLKYPKMGIRYFFLCCRTVCH